MSMNLQQLQAEIRGSDEEIVLLAAHALGGSNVFQEQIKETTTLSPDEITFAAIMLRQRGLADTDVSFASEVDLTPLGRRLAGMIGASRLSGPERWDAVQMAVLRFCEHSSSVRDILTVDTNSAQITEAELRDALAFLDERGLVQGHKDWADDMIVANLTYHGRRALQLGSVTDYLRTTTGMTGITNDNSVHVSATSPTGPINVVGGQNNTVSITQELTADTRNRVAELIDEAINSLPEVSETTHLQRELADLRQSALEPSETKETLRAKIGQAIATSTASEITKGAVTFLLACVGLLG